MNTRKTPLEIFNIVHINYICFYRIWWYEKSIFVLLNKSIFVTLYTFLLHDLRFFFNQRHEP